MKVELIIDDKARIPVSYEMLESAVDRYPVTEGNIELLEALADYPGVAVRVSLAGKDKMTESLFKKLFASGDFRVIQALLDNGDAMQYFDCSTLSDLIKQSDFACSVARNIEKFNGNDALISALADHADPYVRGTIAENYSAPKKLVKALTKDPDPAVARSAANTLS